MDESLPSLRERARACLFGVPPCKTSGAPRPAPSRSRGLCSGTRWRNRLPRQQQVSAHYLACQPLAWQPALLPAPPRLPRQIKSRLCQGTGAPRGVGGAEGGG